VFKIVFLILSFSYIHLLLPHIVYSQSLVKNASLKEVISTEQVELENLKVAFIYNFVSYSKHFKLLNNTVNFCTVSKSSLSAYLPLLESKKVNSSNIKVFDGIQLSEISKCSILYFPQDLPRRTITDALKTCENQPILTVGETYGFVEQGGRFAFDVLNDKISFFVNRGSAEKVGIEISAAVLKRAREVIE
jgi:hypothetical protein